MSNELTPTETANVLRAVYFLRAKLGSWASVAAALEMESASVSRVRSSSIVTPSFTFRVARALGVGIDPLLAGKHAPDGVCPHCAKLIA